MALKKWKTLSVSQECVRNLNTAEGYAEVVILIRKKLEKEGSRSLQRFLVVSFEYFRTSD